ncbi:hypothetical protein UFOVP938_60 [uncultured Caudovirales phage]|uniref:Uncharacterized protein n=1 Tax=uncultured Caudovirales phage TaxID=2100421 RepID=A0A6J5SJB1_9CAUD|nr:hypothetical protein UFOVP596_45 [uncultured Caudovirales phage]CAB4172724.1 hypothetical protein UFOVP938_60 [uncultured Caudovirales phage]CAB4183615.1 hypothetical protein UFOVP1104_41 [uncultured Caudovirales phage]CAB4202965.1 hypothetical protein UFOVP1371_54 [uncultured Caudovirales phage]CAB4214740.1 hypothetical protein UFOVP1468_1 [uncultured Caudovirales phage]
MNKSQTKAIETFRKFLLSDDNFGGTKDHPLELTEFSVKPTEYGTAWISAELEITSLPKTSLLRALDRQSWFVEVGKLGCLTVHIGRKSLEQFKGKKFFGMNIKSV